jgi:hypothetical protein
LKNFSYSSSSTSLQGLTLVHSLAQLEPFLTQHTPSYPLTPAKHHLNDP